MDKFVCLGNVRKGTSVKQARAIFHLPDKVTMIFGQPQESEGNTRAQSMFWGVWVTEEEYEASKGKIFKPKLVFLQAYFANWWSYFRQSIKSFLS